MNSIKRKILHTNYFFDNHYEIYNYLRVNSGGQHIMNLILMGIIINIRNNILILIESK